MINYSEPIDPYTGMTKNKKKIAVVLHVLMCISAIILCVFICLIFSGCTTTKYVPVVEYRTDTLRQYLSVHDSIYLKDSTHVSEKGDTIKIEHWRTEYIKKEVHDTTYVAKHDTIPQPYPVEKKVEVEKPLTAWQSFRMVLGTIAMIALLLYIVGIIIKKKFL